MKYNKRVKFRTNGLFILGGVLFLMGETVWMLTQDVPPPEYYSYALFSVWSLCIFIGSIFVIKYKKAPGIGSEPGFTGSFALFIGVAGLLISGFGFIFFTYEALIRFLGN